MDEKDAVPGSGESSRHCRFQLPDCPRAARGLEMSRRPPAYRRMK